VATGCAAGQGARDGGLDANALPAEVRADYQVFAARCSKCHALARPLKSGIDSDAKWAMTVDRMRRQPGSMISADDATQVLRFLRYYWRSEKAAHESGY
jgi:hypothetical protein